VKQARQDELAKLEQEICIDQFAKRANKPIAMAYRDLTSEEYEKLKGENNGF